MQCETCKTLTYEVFEFINSSSICFNMLDATYNDPDVEIVEEENGLPSIILILSMIEKGNVTRTDQIQYFVEHFGSSNSKTRLILQDNLIALIAVLAFDDVSTGQKSQREMVLFQLMTISIDAIMNNYKLKDYPQEKVLHLYLYTSLT